MTAFQILDNDEIIKSISFISCNDDYKEGYNNLYGEDVFILQFPEGKDLEYASGKILDKHKCEKIKKYEFAHSVDTDFISSGSPLISFKGLKVVGVHTGYFIDFDYNVGGFLGELLKIIIEEIKSSKNKIGNKDLNLEEMNDGDKAYI